MPPLCIKTEQWIRLYYPSRKKYHSNTVTKTVSANPSTFTLGEIIEATEIARAQGLGSWAAEVAGPTGIAEIPIGAEVAVGVEGSTLGASLGAGILIGGMLGTLWFISGDFGPPDRASEVVTGPPDQFQPPPDAGVSEASDLPVTEEGVPYLTWGAVAAAATAIADQVSGQETREEKPSPLRLTPPLGLPDRAKRAVAGGGLLWDGDN